MVGPAAEDEMVTPKVTRSIMIKRPAGCPSPGNGTPPASPSGSTPPVSPFAGEVSFFFRPFSLLPRGCSFLNLDLRVYLEFQKVPA